MLPCGYNNKRVRFRVRVNFRVRANVRVNVRVKVKVRVKVMVSYSRSTPKHNRILYTVTIKYIGIFVIKESGLIPSPSLLQKHSLI